MSIPNMPKIPTPIAKPGANVPPRTTPAPPKPPTTTGNAPRPPVVTGNAPKPPAKPAMTSNVTPPTKPASSTGPKLPVAPTMNTTDDEQKKALEKLNDLKGAIKDIQTSAKDTEIVQNEEVKQENAQEVTIDTTEEVKSESKIVEKAKEVVENKSETLKETKKRNQRKNKTEETKTVITTSEETIIVELKPTCKDFQAMEDAICNTFNDPAWEAEKESIALENSQIIIDEDMNPSTLKIKVAQLCALRNRIYLDHCKYQTNFQNLVSDKPEGIIERTKRLYSRGNNDFERRRNGIVACMQYELNGQTINLFELLEQTRERYNFYKSIMDSIEWKSKTIITMNSAILMEQKLEK